MVYRTPVLTPWAAVAAEVLGFEHDEALALRRAVAKLLLIEARKKGNGDKNFRKKVLGKIGDN